MGATTFGVLCIHANCDSMRQWLWQDVLKNSQWFGSAGLLAHAVVSVIGVFVICSFIDWLRIQFLEKPFFRFWDKHWHIIEKHYYRIEQKIQVILSIKE